MEIKTIITVIIAGMLGAVVFAGLLPVFADTSSPDTTFTNEGLWRMSALEPGDTWVRTSTDNSWSYNNEVVLTSENSASNVILGNNWAVRGNGIVWSSVYYTNNPDITVTVNEDTVVVQTKTYNSLEGYGLNPDGDYIMTQYNNPVYVNGDSQIYATGATTIDGLGFVVHLEGSINDGVTVECNTVNNTSAIGDFEVSNININAVEEKAYKDLYRLEGITFDVAFIETSDETPHSGTASYSSYVVPYEVTSEKTYHPDGPTSALLNLLPVLIAIGLIVGIAGAIFVKRM